MFFILSTRFSVHVHETSNCDFCSYRPWEERKFVVFESKLLELFQICPSCSANALYDVKRTLRSMVKIKQTCGTGGFSRIWQSQSMVGSVPAGNLIFLGHINKKCILCRIRRLIFVRYLQFSM